jgi:hypothetical protein
MSRLRSLSLAALVVTAVACGAGTPTGAHDGGGGTSPGGGGSGGNVAGDAGSLSGGTGGSRPIDGGGGDGGFLDPAYTCPTTTPAPAPPVTQGTPPGLAAGSAIGDSDTDLLASVAVLPDGGAAVVVTTGNQADEECTLYRVSADGTPTALVSWPHETTRAALVAAEAGGKLAVAGVATAAFTAGGADMGAPDDSSDGFVFLLDVDADGTVGATATFPFTGDLELSALAATPDDKLVLAGALTDHLDVAGHAVAPPAFDVGPLRAAFVVRLDAHRALDWQRVLHATGKLNDPPAYDGAGGTDGFGQSSATDVAVAPDGGVVVSAVFTGGIDLDDIRLPNDDYSDGLVVKFDDAGNLVWTQQIYGLIGAYLVNTTPPASGGVSGNIPPDGTVRDLSLDIDTGGRVAVTGALVGHAKLGDIGLDGGMRGHFTTVIDAGGVVTSAVPDGGVAVTFDASGNVVLWDGSSLFALGADGSSPWTLMPGGQILAGKPSRVRAGSQGLWLAGSFLAAVDLGAGALEAGGCADAFVARYTAPLQ